MKRTYASQNFSATLLLIGGIVGTIYMLFVFSNAIWTSRKQEELREEFSKDIARLEEENRSLAEKYKFQKTEQSYEKYAKTNLGKVNPGEVVIIFQEGEEEQVLDFTGLTEKEKELEILKNRPIREQWKHFFFGM